MRLYKTNGLCDRLKTCCREAVGYARLNDYVAQVRLIVCGCIKLGEYRVINSINGVPLRILVLQLFQGYKYSK